MEIGTTDSLKISLAKNVKDTWTDTAYEHVPSARTGGANQA